MPEGDVQLRNMKSGLLVRFEEGEDFHHLKDRLAEKLDAAQKFFDGSAITIDVGNRILTTEQLLELEALFSARYGVRILQVVNGGDQPAAPDESGDVQVEPGSPGRSGDSGTSRSARPASREPVLVHGAAEEGWSEETLFVKRTIRSGQRISYDGNIVILGDINPGAEVIASGDIVVMGALRGLVHAGARGNKDALVLALNLNPTQLRIGGIIGRAPDAEAAGEPGSPEVARVRGGEIVIDSYPQEQKGKK